VLTKRQSEITYVNCLLRRSIIQIFAGQDQAVYLWNQEFQASNLNNNLMAKCVTFLAVAINI
jgi:hypothetical protein